MTVNISLGARMPDGRRIGIEWRRRRTSGGTVVRAVFRHKGDLTPDDLERCLAEIGEGERILASSGHVPRRRKVAS